MTETVTLRTLVGGPKDQPRPTRDQAMIKLAEIISTRSNCCKRHFGVVITRDDGSVISMGYNGTPMGTTNCFDGGCVRCNDPTFKAGEGYDLCTCVHAEANGIVLAAKNGIQVVGTTMWGLANPCVSCLKEIIQGGIKEFVYAKKWQYDDERQRTQYDRLIRESGLVMRQAVL